MQITGVKRNVLFLQRASMRKLIKGKHEKRCSFLERKGDRRSRWIVDSSVFEYGKPADVLRLKSVFSLTSYLLTLTYLLMVTHRLMSRVAHTDLQISLRICTDLHPFRMYRPASFKLAPTVSCRLIYISSSHLDNYRQKFILIIKKLRLYKFATKV